MNFFYSAFKFLFSGRLPAKSPLVERDEIQERAQFIEPISPIERFNQAQTVDDLLN